MPESQTLPQDAQDSFRPPFKVQSLMLALLLCGNKMQQGFRCQAGASLCRADPGKVVLVLLQVL